MIYGFDYDGTLVRSFSADPLPGRRERLAELRTTGAKMFLATNQSGPVYRAYLNDPKFPTVEQVAERLAAVTDLRGLDWQPDLVLVSCHPGRDGSDWKEATDQVTAELLCLLDRIFAHRLFISALPAWRKPAPGMLQYATTTFGCARAAQVIYIGDMETDCQAAQAAGCRFDEADSFFAESSQGGESS